MGAFFCVCVLPFKTKFLKKRDEEMKMKMRERERERSRLVALFSSSVLLQSTRRQKKKSLSLPRSLPKSKVDNNPPKSLFCA